MCPGNGLCVDPRGFVHSTDGSPKSVQPPPSIPRRRQRARGDVSGELGGVNGMRLADARSKVGHAGHSDVKIIRGVGTGSHNRHRAGGVATKASEAASHWNGENCWICGGWRPVSTFAGMSATGNVAAHRNCERGSFFFHGGHRLLALSATT